MRLEKEWKKRCAKRKEAIALESRAGIFLDKAMEGDEDSRLRALHDKDWALAVVMSAESDIMEAKADIEWLDAVVKAYGNTTVEWIREGCHLPEEGEFYKD